MTELKKTPLNEVHRALGAKMVDFGGWDMPVQYSGILEEHKAVRTKAGLFDVSHMGEIRVKGPDALKLVQKLITNDASKLSINQIQYAVFCLPSGGTVDDLLVYKVADDEYLLVVNASNTDKDYAWVAQHKDGYNVEIVNESADTAQIAIQGPYAEQILQGLTSTDLSAIKNYWFTYGQVDGVDCLISRTGYTGEDGFEIYCPPDKAVQLWNKMLSAGGDNILPCGLGARDTLRFEAKMPLYGHELGEDVTPLEAGLGRFVVLEKEDFIGKDALVAQKAAGIPRKVVGFEMIERGIARAGYPVKKDGQQIGHVTTGSFSPTLEKNLGLAILDTKYAEIGETITVEIRNKDVKAQIVRTPFYKREAK
ncbi:glycine cleavage system aminomethyltransferase GcvT [Zhaonella formicivorans]|uniref:glycine cleavage system aminomethyltransferase GcvT n=1 Tax=Zhaonella formicivorans TaxID=2528593 RepID=UPI0010EF02E9|nr:glycine cleavage system aminomethyltransferase GcvT [Zhaonella formicivorans]